MGQPDEVVPHVPFDELPGTRLKQAVTHVESERPRLSGEFDAVSSENLAVSGLFFVAVRS